MVLGESGMLFFNVFKTSSLTELIWSLLACRSKAFRRRRFADFKTLRRKGNLRRNQT